MLTELVLAFPDIEVVMFGYVSKEASFLRRTMS